MDTIKGHVETIVYQAETGFTVARLQTERQKLVTILGSMPSLRAGECVEAAGTWQTHPQHGKQFYVETLSTLQPSSTFGIQKYLESGLIQGIGPVYAKKIVERFGENTLSIIQNAPQRLREVPGLGEKRLEQIVQSWNEHSAIRDVMIFLQSHQISPAYAQKIYQRYGKRSVDVVRDAPYLLAKEVLGIGFKMADTIAMRVGFARDSEERIVAGISHILWEYTAKGHTCLPLSLLCKEGVRMLEVAEELVLAGIEKATAEKEIITEMRPQKDGAAISYAFAPPLYASEMEIAQEIDRIQNSPATLRTVHVLRAIEWVEKELSLSLASEQKKALGACLEDKIHIVTGGPGTGKSTLTGAIIAILAKITRKIILAAPTGRAAKRLTQITRKKALTIHSLLEPDFVMGGFKRGRKCPLVADFVIVDEASMIDTELMRDLLRAIGSSRLLFIGDVDQLPSVGPGNVLQDLIYSGKIGTTRLVKIFRQAAGSHIVVNAHKINQGLFPILGRADWSDFHFYEATKPEEVVSQLLHLIKKVIPEKKPFHPIWDLQILSPMKKGPIGTGALNQVLQEALNPDQPSLLRAGISLRLHDKVMQIKNNYQKNVCNGEFGEITEIDSVSRSLTIAFDGGKMIPYEFSELDEIQLAYAVSVHKSQGSEFPCVVVLMHSAHYPLLCRNLLYTATTRARKFAVVIGEKKALRIAIENDEVMRRHTGLQQALQKKAYVQERSLPFPIN
ncbi:MAG: ATP-dependent RecD-like DNA helicase [Chlamydiota bacterium]